MISIWFVLPLIVIATAVGMLIGAVIFKKSSEEPGLKNKEESK